MESPPPPLPLSTAPSITPAVAQPQPPHPNSIDSSPRSRKTNSWDDPPPPTSPQPPKLRFMCSYGGHIVPRPHDKSLCYIGGTTRIIVIDRNESFPHIHHRLSKTLLNNELFTLRYQLPSEDLDSLISVASDEDFENMVEEYDRLNFVNGSKSGRIRLFLFPKSSSIEQLLVETSSTKSEEWFLDALNGKASIISGGVSDPGFSESSSVNCLLGLEDDFVGKVGKDVGAQIEQSKNGGTGNAHDMHSVPDSPMLETTSSFGSTSSSPSTANLPPARVYTEENQNGGLGIEEQFQQINFGIGGNVNLPQKPEEASGGFTSATTAAAAAAAAAGNLKPEQPPQQQIQSVQIQLQQKIPQFQQKQAGPIDLLSPDSVSSDGSIASQMFRQGQIVYKEPIVHIQSGNTRLSVEDQNNSSVQMHPQVQEPYYILPSQFEQTNPQLRHSPHFVHSNTHYVPTSQVPIGSYYPVYSSHQQYRTPHTAIEQQYPVYFLPARPPQGYNLPMQPQNYSEISQPVVSGHPQKLPGMVMPSTNAPPVSKPEVPSSLHQAQFVGFSQSHHPLQSMALPSAPNSNYAYAYADPRNPEIYYQTVSSAPTMVLPDASSLQQTENIKHLKTPPT